MHIAISEGSFWARASRDRDERRDPAGAAARTSTTAHPHTSLPDRELCTGVIAYSRYHAVWGGGRRAAQTATTTATPPGQRRGPRRHWRGAGGRRAGTLGRAPTEQTVAGMLTHGHASTVSSSGMTDHILIRAHRRPAHSRLSLSSSTHPPASEGQRRFVHSGQGGRHGISAFTKTESC